MQLVVVDIHMDGVTGGIRHYVIEVVGGGFNLRLPFGDGGQAACQGNDGKGTNAQRADAIHGIIILFVECGLRMPANAAGSNAVGSIRNKMRQQPDKNVLSVSPIFSLLKAWPR